jgi:uncharacterized membrane protein YuzA (DUF378 family)
LLDMMAGIVGSTLSILFFIIGFAIVFTIMDYCGLTQRTNEIYKWVAKNIRKILSMEP